MKLKYLIIAVLSFFSIASHSQDSLVYAKLDSFYTEVLKNWDIPGMSIGIVKGDRLVFSKSYGVKEVGSTDVPDENTLYAVASNSKAFTSAIIAMLVQEGKLDWNDKVKSYLPYFELYDPWVTEQTTIRDILSHRVGLGTFSGDVMWYKSDFTEKEIIERIKYVPQAFDFRAGYGYSNLMYITAGEVIRAVTGKSWSQNVKERILKPLGMNRTITSISAIDSKGNYASPHMRRNDSDIPIPWVSWDNVAATGGLISSVRDMAKWVIFNLNHGIVGRDTLLTPESRNLIWTPHNPFKVDHVNPNDFNRHFSSYALGWGVSDYHGKMLVGHTGGYDGFITLVNMIPDEDLGVIVLTNGVRSPIRPVAYYTLDAMLGVPEKDWSKTYLDRIINNPDTRKKERIQKKKRNTTPTHELSAYEGIYHSDLIGNIQVNNDNGILRLEFERNEGYNASLEHWHYDTWKINWNEPQAWFDFGTVQFDLGNNLEIKGLDFDVPNYDIFFEELKAKRVD